MELDQWIEDLTTELNRHLWALERLYHVLEAIHAAARDAPAPRLVSPPPFSTTPRPTPSPPSPEPEK